LKAALAESAFRFCELTTLYYPTLERWLNALCCAAVLYLR
jgi:hypothetical protein